MKVYSTKQQRCIDADLPCKKKQNRKLVINIYYNAPLPVDKMEDEKKEKMRSKKKNCSNFDGKRVNNLQQ